MSSRTNSRKSAGATSGPWYLPLHQDAYFEALATGIVSVAEGKVVPISTLDQRLLQRDAHGFDYGSVGLLELAGTPSEASYILLGNCNTFWLRSESERSELEGKLELFPDTVSDALPIRVNASLFEPGSPGLGLSSGELDLPVDVPAEWPEEPQVARKAKESIVSLAGAISMARHRCLQLAIGVDSLPEILRLAEPPAIQARWAASFALGAMDGLLGSVARGHASREELLVIGKASDLLAGMDPAMGIEIGVFAARLLEECGEDEGAATAANRFRETIAKLSDNQLELSTARIDDSGQIGLRALMVFLLAPEPDQLLRWMSVRGDVGASVSILASVFSGLYSGLGGVPRQVKAPTAATFLATAQFAESMLEGNDVCSVEHAWSQEGEERHVMHVAGLVFAESTKRPTDAVSTLLGAVRAAGGMAEVNTGTGAISVGVPVEATSRTATATAGPSRWVGMGPVAELSLSLRRPGKGALPRDLLERLLSSALAPVKASLGAATGEVLLSVEVSLQGNDVFPALKEALIALHQCGAELGLTQPPLTPARKRAPRKSPKESA